MLKGVAFDADLLRLLFSEDVNTGNDIFGMMIAGGIEFGKRDTLISIEEVEGTQFDDVLMDDKRNHQLDGNEGDDRLVLRCGNDGAEGNEGADNFVFKGANFGFDIIDDFTIRRWGPDQDHGRGWSG